MNKPRITIARLMAAIFIIALNAGLIRAFVVQEMFCGGILMFFAMQAGLFFLLRGRGRSRQFWIGFEILGGISVIALYSCEVFPDSVLNRIVSAYTEFADYLTWSLLPDWASSILFDDHNDWYLASVYFLPELGIALLSGLCAASFSLRPRSRAESPGQIELQNTDSMPS